MSGGPEHSSTGAEHSAPGPAIDSGRVIADLRELDRLTADPSGAMRVCWTESWRRARELLGERLTELGIKPRRDSAGNLWARLEGRSDAPALAVGSHLDSVPGGGWLDGALGVMAGLGALRSWIEAGERPPRTMLLVDWADEEGARFGRSLFGSSAWSGTLDVEAVARLRDADGVGLAEALAENGLELERVLAASRDRPELAGYLELHIEQGPVLESEGLAAAAVCGCAGVERQRLRFAGRASHAGTTPMDSRRDAGLAAAETMLAAER
nr:hydantoinase/carbamoylase family amidase [Solirubrobacterales bacterium]